MTAPVTLWETATWVLMGLLADLGIHHPTKAFEMNVKVVMHPETWEDVWLSAPLHARSAETRKFHNLTVVEDRDMDRDVLVVRLDRGTRLR